MNRSNVNFVLAVAASLVVHALFVPVAERVQVEGPTGGRGRHWEQVTVSLSVPPPEVEESLRNRPESAKKAADPSKPPPDQAMTPVKAAPKPAIPDLPEDMGVADGKGIGSNSAKGDVPLHAAEADEDQAFLSRDPVGLGRVGDLPTPNTGPRGEGGVGGQTGSAGQIAMSAEAVQPPEAPPARPAAQQMPSETKGKTARPDPEGEPPEPTRPELLPPNDVMPPSADTKLSLGGAPADKSHSPTEEVRPSAPLAQVADAGEGTIVIAPEQGVYTPRQDASGTALPMPEAPRSRPAVLPTVVAPAVTQQVAQLAAPAIDEARIAPKILKSEIPETPASQTQQTPAALKPNAPRPTAVVAMTSARPSTGDGRAPGPNQPSADPAQESDSESDPFSVIGSADWHDGKLEPRKGRKIKTTRPRLLLGGQVDVFTLGNPTLVLKISIDDTGKVTAADIVKSSGSVDIDQPCRVAVYDWWFEPSRDKKGHPMSDVLMFTIHFR